MEYIICAFRSRQHAIRFYEFIKSNGYMAEVINTPKEAGVGCGLSVKMDKLYFSVMKKGIKITNFNSFSGYFLVKTGNGRRQVISI